MNIVSSFSLPSALQARPIDMWDMFFFLLLIWKIFGQNHLALSTFGCNSVEIYWSTFTMLMMLSDLVCLTEGSNPTISQQPSSFSTSNSSSNFPRFIHSIGLFAVSPFNSICLTHVNNSILKSSCQTEKNWQLNRTANGCNRTEIVVALHFAKLQFWLPDIDQKFKTNKNRLRLVTSETGCTMIQWTSNSKICKESKLRSDHLVQLRLIPLNHILIKGQQLFEFLQQDFLHSKRVGSSPIHNGISPHMLEDLKLLKFVCAKSWVAM